MTDAPSYAVNLTVGFAFLLSLATLFRLFQKHIDGRPLLEYEPRRPAPWNFLAPLVMLAPLLLATWSAFEQEAQQAPTAEIVLFTSHASASAVGAPPAAAFGNAAMTASVPALLERMDAAESLVSRWWLQSVLTIAMALACYAMLALAFGATSRDLGLPRDWRQFGRDVSIGATAWAASLAPIYMILHVLNEIFEPEGGHPLIEELITDHSLNMMAAAAFAAVVAAPLYEETAFRLVFQGWLERRDMLARPAVAHEPTPPFLTPVGAVDAERDPLAADGPAPPSAHVTYTYASPGWMPVLISSVLFGLAHYGHGVSPAPLILLGVVMGYLYQRTHRIVPSIVCHLLFNGFTFVILALQFAESK
jgi:membrane protease YdiL (CAAX protease family)